MNQKLEQPEHRSPLYFQNEVAINIVTEFSLVLQREQSIVHSFRLYWVKYTLLQLGNIVHPRRRDTIAIQADKFFGG